MADSTSLIKDSEPKLNNPLGNVPLNLTTLFTLVQTAPQETQRRLEAARQLIDEHEQATNFLKHRHTAEIKKLRDNMEKQKVRVGGCLQGIIDEPERKKASKTPSNSKPKQHNKVPNPPIFTGNNKDTASWLQEMKLKLVANADMFPDEQDKLTHIYFRTGGKARTQLSYYLDPDGEFKTLKTADDMMKILEIYFGDVEAMSKARDEWCKLHEEPANCSLDGFIFEFNRLAHELGITDDAHKIEAMMGKLSVETHHLVISSMNIPEDYLGFVGQLRRLDADHRYCSSKKKA